MDAPRRTHGLTILELMVAVAIAGIAAAMAVPSWLQFQQDQRVRTATREVANAMQFARVQAIATGNNHVVYFGMGPGTDACGNPLQDANGNPVPILVLDDGPPGAGTNCCIDVGDTVVFTSPGVQGVNWGTTRAGAPPANDTGAGALATGSTFTDPNGAAARWVLFRPDGIPVAFTPACNRGEVGTGGGGVYVTNGNRDYGIVLSPLGANKVHRYDAAGGLWID